MNEVAKANISTKLTKAIEKEGLQSYEAADILGILPAYVTAMKNPQAWYKVAKAAWENVLEWINTGQSLKEYSEKHGAPPAPLKPKVERPDYQGEKGVESKNAQNTPKNDLKSPKNEGIQEGGKEAAVNFEFYKEQHQIANKRIDELMQENNELRLILSLAKEKKSVNPNNSEVQIQKVPIDIEINLIVNGKKICLS